jgi:hypothetical protein
MHVSSLSNAATYLLMTLNDISCCMFSAQRIVVLHCRLRVLLLCLQQ